MQATHECDSALLENKTDAIIAKSNAKVFPRCFKTLEVGNLMEGSGGFDLFDHFLDSSQQPGIGERRQILVKGLAKEGIHAARSSRRKTFLRLIIGDFSPS